MYRLDMSISEVAEEIMNEKNISLIEFLNYLKKNKIEVISKQIKATNSTGYIYLNKKLNGKRCLILVYD